MVRPAYPRPVRSRYSFASLPETLTAKYHSTALFSAYQASDVPMVRTANATGASLERFCQGQRLSFWGVNVSKPLAQVVGSQTNGSTYQGPDRRTYSCRCAYECANACARKHRCNCP